MFWIMWSAPEHEQKTVMAELDRCPERVTFEKKGTGGEK